MAHLVRSVFRQHDRLNTGLIDRAALVTVLLAVTDLSAREVDHLLAAAVVVSSAGQVSYLALVDFLFGARAEEQRESPAASLPPLAGPSVPAPSVKRRWPTLGVSLAVLRRAIERLSAADCEAVVTVSDIRDQILLPELKARPGLSYAELLHQFPEEASLGSAEDVGPACCLWIGEDDLQVGAVEDLDAAEAFVRQLGGQDPNAESGKEQHKLWLNVFCREYFLSVDGTSAVEEVEVFPCCLAAIGRAAVHVHCWHEPQCLFRHPALLELFRASSTSCVDFALSRTQERDLVESLSSRIGDFLAAAASIDLFQGMGDVGNAIDSAERSSLNERATGKLRRWLFETARRHLDETERDLGPEHPDTLTCASQLGRLLHQQGHLTEAESLYRRAHKGSERKLGVAHPSTLIYVHNLGDLLQDLGRLTEAEAILGPALEASEKVLGPEHEVTLTCVNNLGRLLQQQGRLFEAETLYRHALAASTKASGEDHPHTLTYVHNLGEVFREQGHLDAAEPLQRRALEGRELVLSKEHPETLASAHNLAGLLSSRGKLAEAETIYRRTLDTKLSVLGADHPSTLRSVNNLGLVVKQQGRLEDAEPLYRQALEVKERTLGPSHPSTLKSLTNLGVLLKLLGKIIEAEPLHRRALEGRRLALGEHHPSTLQSATNLGQNLQAQGKTAEAQELLSYARSCPALAG